MTFISSHVRQDNRICTVREHICANEAEGDRAAMWLRGGGQPKWSQA